MNNHYLSFHFLTHKIIIIFSLIVLMMPFGASTILIADGLINPVAESYILVDKNTGVVFAGENIDKQMGVASVSKLMTAYVYFDKIKADDIDLEKTMIPISDDVVQFSLNSELSGVVFDYDQSYPLDELLSLMLIYSDNGATIAIGEYLFGSEEEVVKQMNNKCEDLGFTNTIYYNTSGLTMSDYGDLILDGTSPEDYNVSTAREQANLAISILNDYPQMLDIVSQPTVEFNGYQLNSYNLMLEGLSMEYEGVKGLKSGSTIEAGYCFTGYYVSPINNQEYISVVLNSSSITQRFNDTAYLYNWVDQAEFNTLVKEEDKFEVKIDNARGKNQTLHPSYTYRIVNSSEVNLNTKEIEYNSNYFNESGKLIEDIPAGSEVGKIKFTLLKTNVEDEIEIDSVFEEAGTFSIALMTDQEIKKSGLIINFFNSIGDFMIDFFESI